MESTENIPLCSFPTKGCLQPLSPHSESETAGEETDLDYGEKPLSRDRELYNSVLTLPPILVLVWIFTFFSLPYITSAASDADPGESSILLSAPKLQQSPENDGKAHDPVLPWSSCLVPKFSQFCFCLLLHSPLRSDSTCVHSTRLPPPGGSDLQNTFSDTTHASTGHPALQAWGTQLRPLDCVLGRGRGH